MKKLTMKEAKKQIEQIVFVEFSTTISELKKLGWEFDDETPEDVPVKVTFQYEDGEITGIIEIWDSQLNWIDYGVVATSEEDIIEGYIDCRDFL